MKTKLTKRESTLLIGLCGFLLIFLGFKFVVEPTLLKNTDLRYELDELIMQETQTVNDILEKDEVSARLTSAKTTLDENLELFAPFNYNDEIDKIITPLIISHELKPVSLHISLQPVEESEFIIKNRVEVTANGTNKGLLTFMDALSKLPYVSIVEITSEFDVVNIHSVIFDYFISLEENLGD